MTAPVPAVAPGAGRKPKARGPRGRLTFDRVSFMVVFLGLPLAPGVRVEGVAPDGTIEAVHVLATAAGPVPGFAVGVQWHPENDWRTDLVSRRIFEAFAAAVHAYAGGGQIGGVSAAAD